jgi:uncharacterized protein (DUF58 family)
MRGPWNVLTPRGHAFVVAGLVIALSAMAAGQRDLMRIGLLLLVLPAVAAVLVSRTRLRMSCERVVEPARVPLGSTMSGRLTLGQEGWLPAGVVMLEDFVPSELGQRPRFLLDGGGLGWRREVSYPLYARVRGRFRTGPLLVRTADPFGLVRIDRQFAATSEIMVTPEVIPLAGLRTAGGSGSTGEARPHRIGVVGQDDALVREYRQGDDVRRIHWRSTARRGDLMVRREEQALDPSASILVDSRASAHAGHGLASSLEWAISAAASIAVHFLDDGFAVEVYEAEGPLHIAVGPQPAMAGRDVVVDRLTELRPRSTSSLHYAIESAAVDRPGQLVVAILGRIGVTEAHALLRLRRNRSSGVALVLDVDTFADEPAGERARTEAESAVAVLRDSAWRVVRVPRGTSVAEAWAAVDQLGRVA